MRYEEYTKRLIDELAEKGQIPLEKFPNVDLYMDQVLTFLNDNLDIYKDEKNEMVMTKTMINNYTKYRLLPKTKNKKYSKEHLAMLLMVYQLKNTLQMSEIEYLMKPILDNFTSEFDDKIDLLEVYNHVYEIQKEKRDNLLFEVKPMMEDIKKRISESDLADDDMLEGFMLILNLTIEAETKKYLAEKLLKEYFIESPASKSNEKKKEKQKKSNEKKKEDVKR